jgi:hypothetical protein
MIVLCTGAPSFADGCETTVVSFPSGDGDPVRITLTRHQLGRLVHSGQRAMVEAFAEPQPELSDLVPFRRGGRA